MLPNKRISKEVKFHVVQNKNFKNARKFSYNKQLNNESSTNKKLKRKTIGSSAENNNILIGKEAKKFHIIENKMLKSFKKMNSAKKLDTIKFKDLILSKKELKEKEDSKNDKKVELPIFLKIGQKSFEFKKNSSSNNINSKTYLNNLNNNLKIINNENETYYNSNPNLLKLKSLKIESKSKKILEEKVEKNKSNNTISLLSNKIFCCLKF